MFFRIIGEVPAKKNSRINTINGRSFPSKRYTEWHNQASLQINLQKTNNNYTKPIEHCTIEIEFIHGDLKRRDSDNGTSSILDTLVDTGIIIDDNWRVVERIKITNLYDKGNPSCEINIIEKVN